MELNGRISKPRNGGLRRTRTHPISHKYMCDEAGETDDYESDNLKKGIRIGTWTGYENILAGDFEAPLARNIAFEISTAVALLLAK